MGQPDFEPPADGSDLEVAIDRAGFDARDDRGLLPIVDARRIVEGASAFREAEDSTRLWAALLSLENARELVRHATRLEWHADPTSPDDIALFERYGSGLLPWAEKTIHEGDLPSRPSALTACLLEIGTPRAFDLLFDLGSIGGDRRDAAQLFREWVEVHPKLGFSLLADRAEKGGFRARQLLRHLANLDPAGAFSHLASARGRDDTDALFDVLCVVRDLSEGAIVSVFDMAAEGEIGTPDYEWPRFHMPGADADTYHAMRLVAVRARSSNDWGVVIERIAGSTAETARVEAYRYGSRVDAGRVCDASRPVEITVTPSSEDGPIPCRIDGPEGAVELNDQAASKLGLKQKGLASMPADAQAFIIGVRAYLAKKPRAFRRSAEEIAALLDLDDAQVIVDSDMYTHVVGTQVETITRRDRFWAARPGDTRVFRSLARAIAERDAGLFRPGKANLDWREHPIPRGVATS